MKNLLFTAAGAICLFCSCGSSSSAEKETPDTYITRPASQQAAPAPGQTASQPGNIQQPVQNNNAPVTVQPVQMATAPVGTGMNPAHGQPGHRCDIAVGAPLNSAPNAAATAPQVQQVTTQAQPVVTNVTPPPTKTAPGMNPPHGQPGHRCDISVGAPLNSKPIPAPAMAPQPLPATMQAEPAKKDSMQ